MKTRAITILMIAILLLAGCVPDSSSPQPDPASMTEASPGVVTDPAPAQDSTSAQEITPSSGLTYPIVETSQGKCYNASAEIDCSEASFAGQDAQYSGNTLRYTDNGNGTITDLVTGLMWQQSPGDKMTYNQAVAGADSFTLAEYSDWRLPTIKELYSLMLFDGTDVSGCDGTCSVTPFIDTRFFKFEYGDTAAGERVIDSQFVSSTKYVSTTMNGDETVFGVNFADGRIKGYGMNLRGQEKTFFVLYVRGNTAYGQNSFSDNGNGTISDAATGLTWMQADSGEALDWKSALAYCEGLDFASSSAWRLPDVKELQSLVDYSRSPDTTNSAAIDPLFSVTAITNEAGQTDYPFYWSSTTHADVSGGGRYAAYVSFGRATGYMNSWVDVHGAGAQRSDPKTGSASEFPQGHGPQGDAIRVENYVRCVTSGNVEYTPSGATSESRPTMQIESTSIHKSQGNGQLVPGGMPPQEAINACSGLSEGAACSFTTLNGTISGTCQSVQQQVACVPANRP